MDKMVTFQAQIHRVMSQFSFNCPFEQMGAFFVDKIAEKITLDMRTGEYEV